MNVMKKLQNKRREKRYEKDYFETFLSPAGMSFNYGIYYDIENVLNIIRLYSEQSGYDGMTVGFDKNSEYIFNINKTLDYPVIFWLKELLKNYTNILDFGGGIGQHFYSYKKYIDYPRDLKWAVSEIPSIVNIGNQVREFKNEKKINFISDTKLISGSDILLAIGSLQCVEDKILEEILSKNYNGIILNRLPLCEFDGFITVQNVGAGAFAPHYIRNKELFVNAFISKGYEIIDEWHEIYDAITINPMAQKEISKPIKYYGFYLRKVENCE